MKKKIFVIFLIALYMLFSIRLNTYAVVSSIDANIYSETVFSKDSSDVVTFLRENFQYNGSTLPKQIKYHTTFSIQGTSNGNGGTTGKYTIYINTASGKKLQIGKDINEQEAKNTYGLPDNVNPYTSPTWEGNIVLEMRAGTGSSTEGWKYEVHVVKIDTQNDLADIKIDESNFGDQAIEEQEKKEDEVENTLNNLKSLWDFVQAFTHNPVGAIVNLFCDAIINLIGDICQTLANFFQTGFVVGNTVGETIKPKPIPVFTYDYLKANQGYNQYTNVSTEEPKGEYDGTNRIKIANEGYGFTQATKIPVAIVDFESLAKNKVSNLDANFLIEDKNQTHSVLWRTIRNAVAVIIRIIIFLAMAILLTMLIINALAIASSAITPIERSERIGGIHDFAKAILMLVGSVVIMAIGIYSNLMIFNIADNSKNTNKIQTNELPIRVYVEEAGYSFSTTTTGYIRYMASIDNVDMFGEKAVYSISYLGMAALNLFLAVIMFARMIIIFGLAILGPLIVIQYALQRMVQVKIIPINYQTWAIWFILISAFQALMAIGYVIVKNAF